MIAGSQSLAERVWGKAIPEPMSGCWLWCGAISKNGYGGMSVNGKQQPAHRLAWAVANGKDVPAGMVVMHACDNPPCVNPDHLRIGRPRDNHHDMVRKGRHVVPMGEEHPDAKLNPTTVRLVRSRHGSGDSCAAIARDLGVSRNCIWRIVTNKNWKNLEPS